MESPPPILGYANPESDAPAGSRASVETTEDGIVVAVPGRGLLHFSVDLTVHALLAVFFLMALIGGIINASRETEPVWGLYAALVSLLSVDLYSGIQLIRMAINPTIFTIERGTLEIQRPKSRKLLVVAVKDVERFQPRTTGVSLSFRALGSLQVIFHHRFNSELLQRHNHAEVAWVANQLNAELSRQKAAASNTPSR